LENHRGYKVLIPEVEALSEEWESARKSFLSNSSHSQDLCQKILMKKANVVKDYGF
jgi:hypothetical protein